VCCKAHLSVSQILGGLTDRSYNEPLRVLGSLGSWEVATDLFCAKLLPKMSPPSSSSSCTWTSIEIHPSSRLNHWSKSGISGQWLTSRESGLVPVPSELPLPIPSSHLAAADPFPLPLPLQRRPGAWVVPGLFVALVRPSDAMN
jgi:hypothetical protein